MTEPNDSVRPALERPAAAIVLSIAAALLIGWLAFLISRSGVSPAILFPLGIGAVVGGCQAMIFQRLNLSPSLVAAVILGLLLGLLAVATEDYSGYRAHIQEFAEKQRGDRLAAMVQATTDQWQPMPLADYLAAVVRRDPVWWSIDVALTLLAAAAVAGALGRAKPAQVSAKSPNSSDST